MDPKLLAEQIRMAAPPKKAGKKPKKAEVTPTPVEPKEKIKLLRQEKVTKCLVTENKKLATELERLEGELSTLTEVMNLSRTTSSVTVPEWTLTPTSGVIALLLISDTHLDEVVNPKEINFANDYNREIAVQRVTNMFANFLKLAQHHLSGMRYDGAVIPLLGDMLSGDIHDELKNTNAATTYESLLFWTDYFAQCLRKLAPHFPYIDVPCVVGNHGRNTKKPMMKGRVVNNSDWLFYCLLARELRDVPNIRFHISESADHLIKIYNTTFCLTHGDQFKGGSGISGLLSPLMLGDARKRKRQHTMKQPYDYLVLGHFHERSFFKSVIVNGSLVGYSEYPYLLSFPVDEPQMSFFVIDQERGITISAPVFAR